MKRKNIIFIAICSILLCSCSGYLAENPKDKFSREEIFSNDAGVIGRLHNAYSTIATYNCWGYQRTVFLSVMSGVCSSGALNNNNKIERIKLDLRSTDVMSQNIFMINYLCAHTLNDVIDAIDTGVAKISNDELKKQIYGDAHLFRAFIYFDLVRHFGDIPVYTEFEANITPKGKSTTYEVYEQILADIQVAIDNLGDDMITDDDNWLGHGSKYSAIGLRSKVHVAMACIAEHPGDPFNADGFNTDPKVYWQKAYNDALAVKSSGKFELMPTVQQLFNIDNRYNKESLMELTFTTAKGNQQYAVNFMLKDYYGQSFGDKPSLMAKYGKNANGEVFLNREVFDAHLAKYPSDPRINATYIHSSYILNENAGDKAGTEALVYPNNNSSAYCHPYSKKHVDPYVTLVKTSDKNIMLLRYAEILLILAEAANELDGKEDEALAAMNEIMLRARNSGVDDLSGVVAADPMDWSKTDTIHDTQAKRRDAIMKEYMYEMHSEFNDFANVRRRGYAYFKETIIDKHNTDLRDKYWNATTDKPKYNSDCLYPEDEATIRKAMLLPIPQAEINTNVHISENNYGY